MLDAYKITIVKKTEIYKSVVTKEYALIFLNKYLSKDDEIFKKECNFAETKKEYEIYCNNLNILRIKSIPTLIKEISKENFYVLVIQKIKGIKLKDLPKNILNPKHLLMVIFNIGNFYRELEINNFFIKSINYENIIVDHLNFNFSIINIKKNLSKTDNYIPFHHYISELVSQYFPFCSIYINLTKRSCWDEVKQDISKIMSLLNYYSDVVKIYDNIIFLDPLLAKKYLNCKKEISSILHNITNLENCMYDKSIDEFYSYDRMLVQFPEKVKIYGVSIPDKIVFRNNIIENMISNRKQVFNDDTLKKKNKI